MTNPQAVEKEPDAQVTPAAEEVKDAQTTQASSDDLDLDSLLSEWDEGKDAKATEPTTKVEKKVEEYESDANKEILDFIKAQRAKDEEATKARANEEYKKTVSSVKGDLKVSDAIVDGWLESKAREDKRIANAYAKRHQNPAAWEKVERKLHIDLRKELNQVPDKASTETREKIASAIQATQSTTDNTPVKGLSEMSDMEFYAYQQQFIRGEL